MGFIVPQMPLKANVWSTPTSPPVGAPRIANLDCNLAWGRRVGVPSTGGTGALGVVLMTMTLLVPKGTDLRSDPDRGVAADLVEVPAGTARYYWVAFVDDLGRGFPNEHRGAILVPVFPRPVPLP
jgi:hypothetical protein